MIILFKFLKGNQIQTEDESENIDASKVLNLDGEGNEELETELSVPATWDMPDEERYVYAFHNSESPKLKVNQISIYGMELLNQSDDNITITALIRSTVTQPIQFEDTTIILSGPDHEPLARKEFDLSNLGALPPNSSRPWEFKFTKKDFLTDVSFPIEQWSLGFEIKQKHRLDLDKSWAQSIPDQTKDALEQLVDSAPSLKPGEVNFMGVEAKFKDNTDLVVTFLIRNGTDKHINLEKIPLGITDASGEEIARGSFSLDNFQVKANTSKPWSFIFPKSMVNNQNPDLSKWRGYVIQE